MVYGIVIPAISISQGADLRSAVTRLEARMHALEAA